jgi:hypothetical protein
MARPGGPMKKVFDGFGHGGGGWGGGYHNGYDH